MNYSRGLWVHAGEHQQFLRHLSLPLSFSIFSVFSRSFVCFFLTCITGGSPVVADQGYKEPSSLLRKKPPDNDQERRPGRLKADDESNHGVYSGDVHYEDGRTTGGGGGQDERSCRSSGSSVQYPNTDKVRVTHGDRSNRGLGGAPSSRTRGHDDSFYWNQQHPGMETKEKGSIHAHRSGSTYRGSMNHGDIFQGSYPRGMDSSGITTCADTVQLAESNASLHVTYLGVDASSASLGQSMQDSVSTLSDGLLCVCSTQPLLGLDLG